MSTRLPFVPVFVYVILLVKCNGNFHYKEGIEETPCNRQTGVALTQVRLGPSQFEEAEIGVQHPATASFKGLALPTSDSYRNDVELQCRMAMRHMSQDALPSSLVLRHMRPELGDMCNADFKPAWTEYEQEAVDEFLGRSVRANETKEPTAENKTEIEEETTCMAPRRTAIESECADMATSSQLAADANGFGYQRRRQRIPYADEPCATASTAPADVAWTDAPIRATMDAKSSGGDATDVCDACDDSFTGDHLHWTASYACDAQSGDARGTADRDEGAAEAEQNSQGCQERGAFVSRVPKLGPSRDQERQQGVFPQFAHCGDGSRQGKRSPAGDRERQDATLVPMACFSPTVSDQVEGVYGTIPSSRNCFPSPSARSSVACQACSTTHGHCKEAHGCERPGGDLYSIFRRGCGGDGLQGRRRSCEGRKRTEDTRRSQAGCEQLGSAVRISREAGAEGQASSQRRRPRRWRQILSQLAAFCAGRRCVTDEYTRQWPSAELASTLDARANTMHWCHSILLEPTFLSPWQAMENATDLALEVGTSCKLKVECFSLPKRQHFADRIVRFQDYVHVVTGDDIEDEFHTPQALALFEPAAHAGRQYPKERPCGDTGSSGSRDTGQSATPRASQPFHFLDRSLPFHVPNYIRHLQHLWNERNVRVPDDEYYRLRTWYIHHQHVRQWRQPRIVEVEGDGTTWHHDLLLAWQDQLRNQEVLNVAVVYPDVRVQQEQRALPHADLILVQGGHDRCGGLATVYPPDSSSTSFYTWAASYPRHLSGHDILTGVNADHFVQTHQVNIYHDWTPIPVTTMPVHWMLNGHSFVVVIHDTSDGAAASSTGEATVQLQPQQLTTGATAEEDADASDVSHENGEGSGEEEGGTTDEEVPPIDQFQGVQVFGLERRAHHCFVHWNSYNTILFEVLQSMGLTRDEAVGYYYFPVPLIDQHPAEEAILLQRVGDIPGGSADRLVLVDITHLAPRGDRPLQQREVLRLPRFLGRVGLLQELELHDYCVQNDFRCTVHHDNQVWHEDDLVPRHLQHAAYLRVEVPPPIACPSPELGRAAKRAHVEEPKAGSAGRVGKGVALFQTEVRKNRAGPVSHSATFPSLHAGHQQGHLPPNRPIQVQQIQPEGWLPQAGMVFLQCARTEYEDEGPITQWVTWYLHHQRYQRNSESRLLRLDGVQHLWFQDICELWSDVMDATQPCKVHLVHPEPPRDTHQRHVGHLILEQGEGDGISALLTGLFDHPTNRRFWHFAAIVPQHIARHEVYEELGINRWCLLRDCLFQVGAVEIHDDGPAEVEAGESIVITIPSRQTIQPAADEVSMMQSSGPPLQHAAQDAVGLPAEGNQCETFSFNVEAPIFYPSRPDLATYPEDLQDLYTLWTQRTFSWDGEQRTGIIVTWYVDQQDQGRRVCHQPRHVRLTEALHTWEEQIKQAWQGVLLVDEPVTLHLVRPSPPYLANDIVAHVIVLQRPQETLCTILVTMYDFTIPSSGPSMQLALTMHEHIFLEHFIHSFGRTQQCLAAGSTQYCQAWHETHQLQLGTPWPGRDGQGIVLVFTLRP